MQWPVKAICIHGYHGGNKKINKQKLDCTEWATRLRLDFRCSQIAISLLWPYRKAAAILRMRV